MKMIKTLAAMAAIALAAPAMAQSGGLVGGAIAGNVNQSAVNGSFSFNANGNGNAQSGSGFNATLGGSDGGAVFASQGLAGSVATATPFTSTSTSFHSAAAGGFATQGASFNANQVMSFGQGEANNAFATSLSGAFSESALSFQAAGFLGGFSF